MTIMVEPRTARDALRFGIDGDRAVSLIDVVASGAPDLAEAVRTVCWMPGIWDGDAAWNLAAALHGHPGVPQEVWLEWVVMAAQAGSAPAALEAGCQCAQAAIDAAGSDPARASELAARATRWFSSPTGGPPVDAGEPATMAGPSRVVVSTVGDDGTRIGQRIGAEFAAVVGKPLPLLRAPDLTRVRNALVADAPHAVAAIDAILKDIARAPGGVVRVRPTVLVGRPGSGKTRLARRLLEQLGVPVTMIGAAAMDDVRLFGTSRGWSTGHASIMLDAIRRHGVANPAFLLDELEKAAPGRHNGNLLDGLLPLLERETAGRWRDPYVMSECDLSALIWLATANSTAGLTGALRDRLRIVEIPDPRPEDVPALAASIVRDLAAERGFDARFVALEPWEVEALRKAFGRHGSIRVLMRQVEAVVDGRDLCAARH
jgi:hypothetical protein